MIRYILFFILILNLYAKDDKLLNVNFKNIKTTDLIYVISKAINKPINSPYKLNKIVNFRSSKPLSQTQLINLLKKELRLQKYDLIKNKNGYKVVKQTTKTIPKKTKKYKSDIMIIDLDNANAQNIVKLIKNMAQTFDKPPFVDIDKDTNCIVMLGNIEYLEQLKDIINHLDKKHPQVYVEAKIIELSTNRVKNIGLQYGLVGGMIGSDGIFSYALKMGGASSIDALNGTIFDIKNLQKGLALGATINLLKQNFALDIVSEPSLLCINNQEASIYVGKTVSILTQTSGSGDTKKDSYKRENIGLSLKIKPRITSNKKVHLNINTILEDIDTLQGSNDQPITSKKQVKTSVLLNHGESVILGGLVKNQLSNTIQKVPLLADMPIFGNLFTNRNDINDKINLIVVVTPYIIDSNQDITYAREELSKIKQLEYQYTNELIKSLKNTDISNKNDVIKRHKKIVDKIFN
jgi:general secretion pathway protein D